MSVLITGASGFVGTNLVPYLQQRSINVVSLSRSNGFDYSTVDVDFFNRFNIYGIVHLAGKAHDLRKPADPGEYYQVNTELTRKMFDAFLLSTAEIFIYISSVKAVTDHTLLPLREDIKPDPLTEYGKSKLAAENYLMESVLPSDKRLYILRPCMIHGPGNKGNLNLLYKLVRKGIPYPLAAFNNQRSFLSVENLCFVIYELLKRRDIEPGIYNVSDDAPLSTNQVVKLIAGMLGKPTRLVRIPASWIRAVAKLGDRLSLSLNTERLNKLTDDYVVSNRKLIAALQKDLPVDSETGFKETIASFAHVD